MRTMKKILLILGVLLTGCGQKPPKMATAEPPIENTAESVSDITEDSKDPHSGYLYRDFTPLVVDMELPDAPFFNDCVDMYNGFLVKNSLYTNLDWWFRCKESDGVLEAIRAIDTKCIKNDEIRNLADSTLLLFEIYFAEEPTSYENDANLDRIMDVYYQYDSLLTSRYNTYRYVDLTADEYWDAVDFAKVMPNYKELCELDASDKNIKKIYNLFKNETDFERRCAYARLYITFVDIADIYETNSDDYEELLDKGIYSHSLFFLWRIWRCIVQNNEYGPSTWSPIANELYNRKRAQIALITLKYLKDHPADKIAINQYVVLCGMANIYRAGLFPFGNELITELYRLGLSEKKDEQNGDEYDE